MLSIKSAGPFFFIYDMQLYIRHIPITEHMFEASSKYSPGPAEDISYKYPTPGFSSLPKSISFASVAAACVR